MENMFQFYTLNAITLFFNHLITVVIVYALKHLIFNNIINTFAEMKAK